MATAPQSPNPLEQLRDIHLPEPISWWPLAPGWWLLALACVVLLAWLLLWLSRRYSANLYRRQALHQVARLSSQSVSGGCAQAQVQELFVVLKQTANYAYPKRLPASLGIEQFVLFLQDSCTEPVFNALDTDLQRLLYAQEQTSIPEPDLGLLFKDAQRWIKQHCPEHKLEHDH